VVVVENLTAEEDKLGRQGQGGHHKYLAHRVHNHSRKPFILDAAVKCAAGSGMTTEIVEACRPYLNRTLLDARPERIIVAGNHAARSVLGRSPQMQSVRRGYGWLYDASWAPARTLRDGRVVRPVPVFLTTHPWQSQTNPMLRDWLDQDLQWACTVPVESLHLPPWDHVTHVVETGADARQAIAHMQMAPWSVLDVETAGRMHSGELRIATLALATSDVDGSYVWDAAALADPDAFEVLARYLEDPHYAKIAQSGKFDLQAVEQGMGVTVQGYRGDTRIWRRTLESDSLADLETMGELVGMGGGKDEAQLIVEQLVANVRKQAQVAKREILKTRPDVEAAIKGTKDQIELLLAQFADVLKADELRALWRGYEPRAYVYGEVPPDVLSRYCATDTVTTARLADLFYDQLTQRDLLFVWDHLWGPATVALSQVESWGFPVDLQRLRLLSKHFGVKLDQLRQRFSCYPGFNPNSPDSVAALLYTTLKLKPLKRSETTGDPSTDKDSLDHLKGQHPVIDDLIEWRHISKLKSQYADGLILHVAPDGRIHTTYNVDGARSGRASSENPNMQNIPSEERDPHDSKLIKDCFVASPGYVLLASDYAQLEFRVAADLADDPDMKAVFLRGDDFHQATAEFIAPIVWKVKPCPQCRDKGCHVTKAMRRGAKAFNFGIMYGMQDGTIAERAGCDLATARAIRAAVLGKFKKFAIWIQQRLAETRKSGLAWTWWLGRRAHCRQLYKIAAVGDANKGIKINAENSTFNTPVQGTASFYCLASVTELVNWILACRIDAKVVATVHDSIVLEVRPEDLDMVARKMHDIMTGWPTMTGVPLDIDMKTGHAWGSLTTYELPDEPANDNEPAQEGEDTGTSEACA
jgi:DNA polymerase I-like protein with 3'-5' exonuclease and polymerase domains/uracil-DNA glycosylase